MAKETIVAVPTNMIAPTVALHSIGLAIAEPDMSVRAGSGTLVQVGNVYGILTAAHCVRAIKKYAKIDIAPLTADSDPIRIKMEMEVKHAATIGLGETDTPDGPDLAFIRTPPNLTGWLKAALSFVNLNREPREFEGADRCFGVFGIVNTLTNSKAEIDAKTKGVILGAVFSNGEIKAEKKKDWYDSFEFTHTGYKDFALLEDFEGASGGSVWKIFFKHHGRKGVVVGHELWGVPYWQYNNDDGGKTLICHGRAGIYGRLLQQIKESWPDETRAK